MANFEYNQKLWQISDSKKEFLLYLIDGDIEEVSFRNMFNFMVRLEKFEMEFLKQDIRDAGRDGISKYLSFLSAGSVHSLKVYVSILENYILFCKENGYAKDTVDMTRFFDEKVLREYVDEQKLKSKYVTEETLNEIVDSLEYYTDKVLLQLVFEGCLGKGGENLANIKYEDLNYDDMTMTLQDGRVLKISEKLKYLVEKSKDEHSVRHYTLINTGYILKPTNRTIDTSDKLESGIVLNRFNTIKKNYGIEYVTLDSIYKSGLFKRCKEDLGINSVEDYNKDRGSLVKLADYFVVNGGVKVTMGYRLAKIFEELVIGIPAK